MGGMMIRFSAVLVAGLAVLAGAEQAQAQNWTGFYVSGSVGAGFLTEKASETVRFDTDLDGTFIDTIRTAAGGGRVLSRFLRRARGERHGGSRVRQ